MKTLYACFFLLISTTILGTVLPLNQGNGVIDPGGPSVYLLSYDDSLVAIDSENGRFFLSTDKGSNFSLLSVDLKGLQLLRYRNFSTLSRPEGTYLFCLASYESQDGIFLFRLDSEGFSLFIAEDLGSPGGRISSYEVLSTFDDEVCLFFHKAGGLSATTLDLSLGKKLKVIPIAPEVRSWFSAINFRGEGMFFYGYYITASGAFYFEIEERELTINSATPDKGAARLVGDYGGTPYLFEPSENGLEVNTFTGSAWAPVKLSKPLGIGAVEEFWYPIPTKEGFVIPWITSQGNLFLASLSNTGEVTSANGGTPLTRVPGIRDFRFFPTAGDTILFSFVYEGGVEIFLWDTVQGKGLFPEESAHIEGTVLSASYIDARIQGIFFLIESDREGSIGYQVYMLSPRDFTFIPVGGRSSIIPEKIEIFGDYLLAIEGGLFDMLSGNRLLSFSGDFFVFEETYLAYKKGTSWAFALNVREEM